MLVLLCLANHGLLTFIISLFNPGNTLLRAEAPAALALAPLGEEDDDEGPPSRPGEEEAPRTGDSDFLPVKSDPLE